MRSPLRDNDFDYFIITVNYPQMDDVRLQLKSLGISANKILAGVGFENRHISESVYDLLFEIKKDSPKIPFSYGKAKDNPNFHGETYKSHNRREREDFFVKYCKGKGLDICNGGDLITPDVCGWEIENGDAQYLDGVQDNYFDYVYSSHGLEHMDNVRIALKNWFRVLKKDGFLIVAIPHRDLYERKSHLPSRWNTDHRHMFLIGKEDLPDTLDIVEEIKQALMGEPYDIKYIKACDYNHSITDPLKHSDGEYQIEFVIQKK